MYYIDTSTTSPSMPTPQAVGTPGWFAQGSPAAGIPYTVTSADWANGITAELINVLAAAGITPNKSQTNQVALAINQLISGVPYSPSMPYSVTLADNGKTFCLTAGGQITLPNNAPPGFKITLCCYAATYVTVVCDPNQNISMPRSFTQHFILAGGEGVVLYYGGAAIWRTIGATPRITLNSSLNLYVGPNSPAGATGFSSADPFPDPQSAWDFIVSALDLGGFPVTVNVAPGTYPPIATTGVVLGSGHNGGVTFLGSGLPTITGTTGQTAIGISPGTQTSFNGFNVVGNQGGAFAVSGYVQITGCTISATGAGQSYTNIGSGINVGPGGVALLQNGNTFGACGFAHMSAFDGGVISVPATSYTVNGATPVHINSSANGLVSLVGAPTVTATFVGTPTIGSVVDAGAGGVVVMQSATMTGSITGKQWNVGTGGFFNRGGATIPGTAGTTDSATFGVVL